MKHVQAEGVYIQILSIFFIEQFVKKVPRCCFLEALIKKQ